jgi:hypothetical protein
MNILTNSTTVNVTNVNVNNEVELYAILDDSGFGASGHFLSDCVFELTYHNNDFDFARLIGKLIIAGFEVNKV